MNNLIEKYPEVIDFWSSQNSDTPYEHGICDRELRWWKCPNKKHDDFYRSIIYSRKCGFVCPQCIRESKRAVNFKDITGQVFGELTVIEIDVDKMKARKNNSMYWKCRCSCGKIKSILGSHLRNGSIITCGDRSVHWSGENGTTWKGGITPTLISARMSKIYNEWRDKVYAKDFYICQCCGKYKNFNKNAHHIINFSEDEKLRYDINNAILLCEECHHIKFKNSFHNIYGTHNNTPQQLEEYINNKRKQLGINIPFRIEEYKKRINIITPELAVTLMEKKEVI